MKQLLKNIISLFGYNISRISHRPGSYIDCRETVLAAEKSGMSLPDYLDAAEPYPAAVGRSARIVKKILDMGLFSVDNRHTHGISMVEIGAGTGKYLARMLPGNITRCEIYEIDEAWSGYLLEQFAAMGMVFVHKPDGSSLAQTSDFSCDLVVAHGVFVYLPILVTVGYLREASRVCKTGAHLLFDVFYDSDWNLETVDTYISDKIFYPVVVPRALMETVYTSLGFALREEFMEYHGCYKTRYVLLEKK